ncbi:MAG: ABC transporter permease [Candidatus Marinimicrobia bacterium]|nr:ABC transporter permease [Candidatus Neomarinimicrobiota bacterium]
MIEYFRSAIYSLISNKLRSALTILGIFIGVWAIVSMQSVVEGFDRSMRNMMAEFGTESFFIQKFPAIVMGHNWRKYNRRKDFTYQDAYYLEETGLYIQSVSAYMSTGAQTIKYKDKKTGPVVGVLGATAGFFSTNATTIADGRVFNKNDEDRNSNVVVLGMDIYDELFPFEDPLGKEVRIGNTKFTVVGVLNPLPGFSFESPDNMVIIPITTYQKTFSWSSGSMQLMLRAVSTEVLDEAMDEAIALMRIRRKVEPGQPNDFEIFTGDSIIDTMQNMTIYIQFATMGIAGISLVVAGIGIMNIMLVSVIERTREIGTRKAVGAKSSAILWQFLIEAIILSQIGAIFGLILAYITSLVYTQLVPGLTANIPLWAVISAFGYCSLIGIVFGLFPARKAARLNPIDALRYE